MVSMRESIEWYYVIAKNLWAFIDYSKNQKLLLMKYGYSFIAAVLLTNAHACMKGNQI